METIIRACQEQDLEAVIDILLLAEPSRRALEWSLSHMSDTVYRLDVDGIVRGAATVRWRDPCEIIELAVAPDSQGKGYGRQLVHWIVAEAKGRGLVRILVGTSNASIGNIRFYQRCGFRMDHVRRDYFWYYREPIFENGIQARDLLMFSFDLVSPPPT